GLAPLAEAGKLGPLLVQFPPSFKPDEAALDYLTDLVRRFGRAGFQLAVELRHRGWTDPDAAGPAVTALFEEEQVAWVMIDEPKFRTSVGDAPLTSRVGYFRFHGRNYAQWWRHDHAEDRYNYLYGAAEQRELAKQVRAVADRTSDTYVFYNNHYKAKAVVNGLQLELEVGRLPRAPLPKTLVREYPELESVQVAIDPVAPSAGEQVAASA
ncbi:MAG TPA: DUF72 domain-containing protein, partial [Dehalococcoidia bacterium]|nr:DUF72 domain-containing protein [Dehalococcoidia bacterium]